MRPIAEVVAYLTAIDAPVTFPTEDDEVRDWADRFGVWEDMLRYVKKLRAIRGLHLICSPAIGARFFRRPRKDDA
ncbi:MAG: hypothetical protein ACK4OJ_08970 [Brevundimonas sp.]